MKRSKWVGVTIVGVAGAVTVTALASMTSSMSWSQSTLNESRPTSTDVSKSELITSLARLGLDPETLAVSGVSSQQATVVVQDLLAYLTNTGSDLVRADSDCMNAARELRTREKMIQTGKDTSAECLRTKDSCRSRLAAAESSRDAAQQAAFTAATASLTQDQVAVIQRVRRNRAHGLPLEFAVTDRTEAEWIALRDALQTVRSHDEQQAKLSAAGSRRPGTPKLNAESQAAIDRAIAAAQSLVRSASTDQAVSLAKSRLETTKDAVNEAWKRAASK